MTEPTLHGEPRRVLRDAINALEISQFGGLKVLRKDEVMACVEIHLRHCQGSRHPDPPATYFLHERCYSEQAMAGVVKEREDRIAELEAERDKNAILAIGNADECTRVRVERDVAEVQLESAREALGSIARNTCCDKCQEAALVARKALSTLPVPAWIEEARWLLTHTSGDYDLQREWMGRRNTFLSHYCKGGGA